MTQLPCVVVCAAAALVVFGASYSTSIGAAADVVTYHQDPARTGQNVSETSLTPATVVSGSTSWVTTAPAPIRAPAPIVTPARMTTPLPI